MTQSFAIDPDDWTIIWQSELSALAVDREWQERMAATARGLSEAAALHERRHDGSAGRAGPDAPAGAAAAGVAPDAGDEIARLRRRIAELEARA